MYPLLCLFHPPIPQDVLVSGEHVQLSLGEVSEAQHRVSEGGLLHRDKSVIEVVMFHSSYWPCYP